MANSDPWSQMKLTFDDRDSKPPSGKLKHVEKLWGHEQWFHEDGGAKAGYCGKILTLFKDYQTSLHYHPRKKETMYVNEGVLELQMENLGVRTGEYEMNTLAPQGTATHAVCLPARSYSYHILKAGESIDILPGLAHRMVCASTDIPYVEIFEVSTPHDDGDVVRLEESNVEIF